MAGELLRSTLGWPATFCAAGLALALSFLVLWFGRRHLQTDARARTAGLLLGASSFALLWLAMRQSNGALVHPAWLLAHYFLMTVGELLLAPIGLSIVSKLAPSCAIGNWLAGLMGRFWRAWPHAYFFIMLAFVLLLTALLVATQLRWLRRAIP